MAEFSLPDNMRTIFENLEKLFTSKTVFGEAITIGEITLIPVMDIAFGMGTGGGAGEDKNKCGSGSGGGTGVGAKMTPSAVIAIKGDLVEVMPLKKSSNLCSLVEMIPEIVGKFKCKGKEGDEENK